MMKIKIVVSNIDLISIKIFQYPLSNVPGIFLFTRADLNNDVAGHVRFNVVECKAIQNTVTSDNIQILMASTIIFGSDGELKVSQTLSVCSFVANSISLSFHFSAQILHSVWTFESFFYSLPMEDLIGLICHTPHLCATLYFSTNIIVLGNFVTFFENLQFQQFSRILTKT